MSICLDCLLAYVVTPSGATPLCCFSVSVHAAIMPCVCKAYLLVVCVCLFSDGHSLATSQWYMLATSALFTSANMFACADMFVLVALCMSQAPAADELAIALDMFQVGHGLT
jgi:hypothetical protein